MRILKAEQPPFDHAVLDEAALCMMRGAVIAFPTDTLYGLGCSLFDAAAVEQVRRLKQRVPGHAFISLIPEPAQADGLALAISPVARRLMQHGWPGPLSLIFEAGVRVPQAVCGEGGTIALRCPRDPLSLALLKHFGGPVVSSSANLSGQPTATTAQAVAELFGNQLALILDGGPRSEGQSSTLVDVSGPRPRLLRQGALDVRPWLGEFEDLTTA